MAMSKFAGRYAIDITDDSVIYVAHSRAIKWLCVYGYQNLKAVSKREYLLELLDTGKIKRIVSLGKLERGASSRSDPIVQRAIELGIQYDETSALRDYEWSHDGGKTWRKRR